MLGWIPDMYSAWFMVAGNDWSFSVPYLWVNRVAGVGRRERGLGVHLLEREGRYPVSFEEKE